MPRNKISEFSVTAADNTDIAGIDIGEGCAPSGINNAIRTLMSDLKDFQAGTSGDPFNGAVNGTVGATTPSSGVFTSLSDSGNLTFTGTGNRITGDFSNATSSNRVSFQSSTVNSATSVNAFPNGTSTVASFLVFNSSDSDNAGFIQMRASTTDMRINAAATGTGTYLPLTAYTGGSERLRIDTSGNVGIGLSNPAVKADINGVMRAATLSLSGAGVAGGTTAFSAGTISTDSNWGYYFRTPTGSGAIAEYIWKNAADTERMRIDSSGRVGIGLVPTGSDGIFNTNINGFAFNLGYGANFDNYYTAGASGIQVFRNAGTERMRIDSAGNVGIGTSSPAYQLHVVGSNPTAAVRGNALTNVSVLGAEASDYATSFIATRIVQNGSSATGTTYGFSNASLGYITFQNTSAAVIATNGATPLILATSSLERMRIDSAGSVLIGRTAKLYAESLSATGYAIFGTSGTGLVFSGSDGTTGVGGTIDSVAYVLKTGNLERIRIDSSGNVGIGITSPTCVLDVVGGIKTSRTAVTSPATTDGNVFSGTYTPTLTNTTNIASSTAAVCQYMRVGNVVTVSGTVTIDPTATGRIVMGLTLPIASALTAVTQCGGTFASSGSTTVNVGSVTGDATNDRATFDGVSNDVASRVYGFSFTYQIL